MDKAPKRNRRKPMSSFEIRQAAERKKPRNVSPRHNTASLLMQGMAFRDPKTEAMMNDLKFGSRNLCRAILETGRTHEAMSEAAQLAAVRYAYNMTGGNND